MPEQNLSPFVSRLAAFQLLCHKTADGYFPFPANTIHKLNANRNLLVRQAGDPECLQLEPRHIPIYFLRYLRGYGPCFQTGATNHGNPVRHSIEEAWNRSTYLHPLFSILLGYSEEAR